MAKVDTTESTISRIESGKQYLTIEWMEKIAAALDIDIASLTAPLKQTPPQDQRFATIDEQVSDMKLLAMFIKQLIGPELKNSEIEALSHAAKKMLATVLALELTIQDIQTQ